MRNHVLKKLPVFALAAVMAIGGTSLSAFAEADPGSGADTLLNEFQGTYTALFPAFRDDRYDAMWEKSLSEYAGVDAENAETVKDAFLSVYESDIHGEEAQKKAEEEPGWFMFDCSFAGGVDSMTFEGNTISGVDGKKCHHTFLRRKSGRDGRGRTGECGIVDTWTNLSWRSAIRLNRNKMTTLPATRIDKLVVGIFYWLSTSRSAPSSIWIQSTGIRTFSFPVFLAWMNSQKVSVCVKTEGLFKR